ncbi:MAG: hypothetical protein FWH03_05535 [Firmicutes bacterium]|nr:hypothetical protein [Bacillota bacterium]
MLFGLAGGSIELLEKLEENKEVKVFYLYPGAGVWLNGFAVSDQGYLESTLAHFVSKLKEAGYDGYVMDGDDYYAEISAMAQELAQDDGIDETTYFHMAEEDKMSYESKAQAYMSDYTAYIADAHMAIKGTQYFKEKTYAYDFFMAGVNEVITVGYEQEPFESGAIGSFGFDRSFSIIGYDKFY